MQEEKRVCEYGCGQEGKYQLRNGKWCCSENTSSCQGMKNKNSNSHKGKKYNWKTGGGWNKGLTIDTDMRVKNAIDTLKERYANGSIKSSRKGHHWSEEYKKKFSLLRIKWLKENPDKHPWKNRECFKSIPCELFKTKLIENGINFVAEFNAIDEHNYSIDVAFPNEKFGIEINGNQHYDRNGNLNPYYQKRHDLLVANGWTLEEIPCSMVYKNEFVESIVKKIKENIDFNYEYVVENIKQREKKNEICPICGSKKYRQSNMCLKCKGQRSRKVERPSKETLEQEMKNSSFVALGKKYGVSDNAVRKWLKEYAGMA